MTGKNQNELNQEFKRGIQRQKMQPKASTKINNSQFPKERSPEEGYAEAIPLPVRGARIRIISRVIASLIVAAAIVILITTFAFPVMKVYGTSMSSTLVDGDVVIALKTTKLAQGDIGVFYFGGRMHCKRVIAFEGDVIEINEEGTVIINGTELEEPYLKNKSIGQCDIEFPYIVPEDSYFVLGDNRRSSIDSRSRMIGSIKEEQVVGRLLFCIYPFLNFGKIE